MTEQEHTAPHVMTEGQVEHMVGRFLTWPLPESFNPDGGVSFERIGNEGTMHEFVRRPSGTNLLDATQATAMVRHMLEGLPGAPGEWDGDLSCEEQAMIDAAWEMHKAARPTTTADLRPKDCRFRLRDENKPYPKSSCGACGKTITTGLRTRCTATPEAATPADLREAGAQELWHRFAPTHAIAWEEETHKEEYRLAFDAVLATIQAASYPLDKTDDEATALAGLEAPAAPADLREVVASACSPLFFTNQPTDRYRIVDFAFTAFLQATRPNSEDGGESDWFNDTLPRISALIDMAKNQTVDAVIAAVLSAGYVSQDEVKRRERSAYADGILVGRGGDA